MIKLQGKLNEQERKELKEYLDKQIERTTKEKVGNDIIFNEEIEFDPNKLLNATNDTVYKNLLRYANRFAVLQNSIHNLHNLPIVDDLIFADKEFQGRINKKKSQNLDLLIIDDKRYTAFELQGESDNESIAKRALLIISRTVDRQFVNSNVEKNKDRYDFPLDSN